MTNLYFKINYCIIKKGLVIHVKITVTLLNADVLVAFMFLLTLHEISEIGICFFVHNRLVKAFYCTDRNYF